MLGSHLSGSTWPDTLNFLPVSYKIQFDVCFLDAFFSQRGLKFKVIDSRRQDVLF
jgi:hypothetical protein